MGRPKVVLTEIEFRRVAAELDSARPVQAQIPAFEAFVLCSALQLALRHEGIAPNLRPIIEKGARDLQDAIAARAPLAGELLEHGWKREFDLVDEGGESW